MIVDTYGYILKQFVDFTKVKFSALAQAIGYDVTYISKWYNGARLPASKKVDIINQNMAGYLADVLIQNGQSTEFVSVFGFYGVHSREELSFQIYDCLSKAYRFSIKKHPAPSAVKIDESRVVLGRAECKLFLQDILKKELETMTDIPHFLITGEFCDLADMKFWNYLESVGLKASQCHIDVNMSLHKLQINPDAYCDSLYHCLNSLINYNFTIYEKKSDANSNMIVLKGKFVVHYIMDTEGFIDMCTFLTHTQQVQTVYEKCAAMFSEQPQLLIPKETLGMQEFGFRDIFFTSNRFFHFLTNGIEYLLPDEVYDSIYEGAAQGLYFPATTYWVERMKLMLKNVMDNSAITFLIPTNTLVRYLETGYIMVTEIHYKLTPAERRSHIDQVLKAMKANPKIRIGVFYSTSGNSSYYNFSNVSFNSNYSTGFFKKNLDYLNPGTPHTALINHPILLDCFQEFFNHLMQTPNYHEYTVEELTRLCENYKSLIEQMIRL